MKRVLIPTDFTTASLQLIEYAILNFPDSKLDIILIAGFRLPDRRWAVTHFDANEQISKQVTNQFTAEKRRILLEHKENISSISIELFTGNNFFAFNNFVEPLSADNAIISKGQLLQFSNSKWFDTTKFIKKSVKNVVEVELDHELEVSHQNFSILSLLNP